MTSPLLTYLHDHLAGANFAISLLEDLGKQTLDKEIAHSSTQLLRDIEFDKSILEDAIQKVGGDGRSPKSAAAWVAEKASRFKLDLSTHIGLFEAVEMLALGVLGKMALWCSLQSVADSLPTNLTLDFQTLRQRAQEQHATLESQRLRLAKVALR